MAFCLAVPVGIMQTCLVSIYKELQLGTRCKTNTAIPVQFNDL